MGWCSGTEIFDKVAEFVLGSEQPEQAKYDVLYHLAGALENEDWDCQEDSRYYNDLIVQRVMRELHPNWEELFEDGGEAGQ